MTCHSEHIPPSAALAELGDVNAIADTERGPVGLAKLILHNTAKYPNEKPEWYIARIKSALETLNV